MHNLLLSIIATRIVAAVLAQHNLIVIFKTDFSLYCIKPFLVPLRKTVGPVSNFLTPKISLKMALVSRIYF